MALSFPPSPAVGDIYLQWQWTGSAWGPIPGGAGSGGPVDWSDITGTPATYPPTLPIAQSGVTNLVSDLGAKAALASPAFTGTPSLPTGTTGITQAAATNNTSLATTAFVKSQAYLTANQTVTLSGDVSGSGTTAITATLATVPIAKGGTGQTSAGAAFNAIAASGGTVGGNTTVSGTLNVNGGAVNGPVIVNTNAGANAGLVTTVTGGRGWQAGTLSDGRYHIYDQTAARFCVYIDAAGACSASSTWAVISDARLKEDVQPYTRGLAEILPLEPITYLWNGKGGVPADGALHFGLSAQQVGTVMPELIREQDYVPQEDAKEGDEPMTLKTYSPTDLTFALINAVRELNERLTAAEAKLTSQGAGQ